MNVKKRVNIICYITMGLLGVYLAGYQNLIGLIAKDYSIASSVTGFIISLHFIGSVIAPIIFGEISDKKGKKTVVMIAFSILIAGLLGVYIFKSAISLSIGIFFIGCGFAVIEGTLSAVLSDINPQKTMKVINVSQMFLSIGAVLGPLFTLFIIQQYDSWRLVFAILIFLFTLTALFFSRCELGEEIKRENKGKILSLKLLKIKTFILLSISMFIYVGVEEGVAFWTTTFFEKSYGVELLGTYALSGYWASMIIGRFIASRASNKVAVLIKAGMYASLLSMILALFTHNGILGFVCFIAVGLGFSAVWPMLISITSDQFQESKGTAVGIMMTSGALGGATVPLIIGIIANYIDIKMAFWIFPTMIVLILYTISKIQSTEA